MSLLAKSLSDARQRGDGLVEMAKAGFGFSQFAHALGNQGGVDSINRNTNNMALHSEQLRHFQGYCYAIIRTIANRIAGQPLRVARVMPAEAKTRAMNRFKLHHLRNVPRPLKDAAASAEMLNAHPLLTVFKRPNPLMVRYTMMFVTIAGLELTGRAYWWFKESEEDGSLQIWPLPASWVEPRHDDMQLYAEWEVRPAGMAEAFLVPGNEIAYFYYPDPANPLGAISPLQALAKTVVADENIEEAQRRAFINGLNPGLAIIVGQWPEAAAMGQATQAVLTRDQRNVILNAVKQQYRGVINNEEPLILDGLIKDAKKISNAPREMDFLNSGQATKGRLAQGWGVNPISMGEIEGANRASSAVADQHLLDNVVNPRIEMFSEILTTFIAPRVTDDDGEILVYIEPASAIDLDYDLSVETAMVDRAAMSRNEWRQRHGLPPIEEGDSVFVGGTEIPVVRDPEHDGKDVSPRRKGSFFEDCERDEDGHCKPGEGGGDSSSEDNSDGGQTEAQEEYEQEHADWKEECAQVDADFKEEHDAWEQRQKEGMEAYNAAVEKYESEWDATVGAQYDKECEKYNEEFDAWEKEDRRLTDEYDAAYEAWEQREEERGRIETELLSLSSDVVADEFAESSDYQPLPNTVSDAGNYREAVTQSVDHQKEVYSKWFGDDGKVAERLRSLGATDAEIGAFNKAAAASEGKVAKAADKWKKHADAYADFVDGPLQDHINNEPAQPKAPQPPPDGASPEELHAYSQALEEHAGELEKWDSAYEKWQDKKDKLDDREKELSDRADAEGDKFDEVLTEEAKGKAATVAERIEGAILRRVQQEGKRDKEPEEPDHPPMPEEPEEPEKEGYPEMEDYLPDEEEPQHPGYPPEPKKPDKGFSGPSVADKAVLRVWEKQANTVEIDYQRALRKQLVALGRQLTADLERSLDGVDEPTQRQVDHAFRVSEAEEQLLATAEPHVERACVTGAILEWELHRNEAKGDRLRVSMEQLPRGVRREVRSLVRDLLEAPSWKGVVPNMREALYRAVNKQARKGLRGRELAREAVKQVLGVNASSRHAARLARTDTTAGMNGGQEASRKTLKKLGVIKAKRWVSHLDDVTRAAHRHAHGQEVAADGLFELAGLACAYPGDPKLPIGERANCRCVVFSVRG